MSEYIKIDMKTKAECTNQQKNVVHAHLTVPHAFMSAWQKLLEHNYDSQQMPQHGRSAYRFSRSRSMQPQQKHSIVKDIVVQSDPKERPKLHAGI